MKISKSIVGIAILGLMLFSSLAPVSAAATWPVAAGDKLQFSGKAESTETDAAGKNEISVSGEVEIEIVKVDANGTIVWKYVGEEAKDETNDIKNVGVTIGWFMGETVIYDSDEWKIKSKALEDASKTENIDLIKTGMKTSYEMGIMGSDFGKCTDVVITYEITSDAVSKTTTYTVTGKTENKESFEVTSESAETWSEDGILQEKTSSGKTTIEKAGGQYVEEGSSTFKLGGLGIPGYSVPIFLGILAFTTLGLIVAIRRRK